MEEEGRRVREDVAMEAGSEQHHVAWPPPPTADLEDGRRVRASRNTSGLWKLEQARKRVLPLSLQQGTQPCLLLGFSLVKPTPDL